MTKPFRALITVFSVIMLLASLGGTYTAYAEALDASMTIPQIDSSTARIPIINAMYEHLKDTYQMTGPEPICSKTHGAWLNLADGAADIIFLIAPTEEEFAYFAEKGVDIEMKVFGYDGLVFLGNEGNPVDNLTSSQIRSIYSGKIKNWNRIPSGKSGDMIVYTREPESGSQRLFESLVWAGYDMPNFQALKFREGDVNPAVTQRKRYITESDGMEEITRSVIVNQYSIGFNIMSYIDSKFLDSSTDDEDQLIRTTGQVHMRTGPGLDSDSVGTLPSGTTLAYLGESSTDDRGVAWYKVRHSSTGEAWVSSRYSKLDSTAPAKLKLFSVDGYAPTTENFESGNYPFVTTSYVAIRADAPIDSPARKLYNWIGTDESRKLISENSTLSVSFSDSVVLRTGERDPAMNTGLADTIGKLDREMLTRSALSEFSQDELGYLRQGVYALSGKAFHLPKYSEYFSALSWYEGKGGSDKALSEQFSEYQRDNLALIIAYEKELIRANANRAGQIGSARTLAYTKGSSIMSGDDVQEAQRALAAQGYLADADCDGAFGKKSANAVHAFQTDSGLVANGEIGVETRMLLLK